MSRTDPLRLAVGTLTALPVPPPTRVDRHVGSWAMTLAPLAGAILAIPSVALLVALGTVDAAPVLTAALVLALLAALTRAMHLDGLADTADGLGSGKPAAGALEVMRRSDIGPFGVVTLLLVLLIEALALGQLVAEGRGALGLLLALVVSRLVLPSACSPDVPAARPDGLGAVVASSVPPVRLGLAIALAALLVGLPAWAVGGFDDGRLVVGAVAASVAGPLAGMLLCLRCVRRLGGVTGDVLGACVEVGFATALVVLALV